MSEGAKPPPKPGERARDTENARSIHEGLNPYREATSAKSPREYRGIPSSPAKPPTINRVELPEWPHTMGRHLRALPRWPFPKLAAGTATIPQ